MTDTTAPFETLPEAVLDAAAEWLVCLNESSATSSDFEEWQRWLSEDPQHVRAFDALEGTWRLSAQAAIAHHSRAPVSLTRYHPEEPISAWVRRHKTLKRRRAWGVAATVLGLAVALGAWWSRQPAVIQTATAEQRVVWLPDHSRITVGPRTRVSYRYSAGTRAFILDEGQAFFEVAKDAHRPFVIDTGHGRIIAVGTAFSVDVMADRLNVTVAEGTVRIENAQPSGPTLAPPIFVTAGRRYVAAASTGAAVTALPAVAPEVSWRDGRLAYYGDPLNAVVADLNRYAPDPIELDASVGDLQYTGTVFTESLNDWLTSLPTIFPVRVERRERGWLIVRRTSEPIAAASSAH
jgi:transmembrane sensor